MLWTLVRKEIALTLLSNKFLFALSLLCALILSATYVQLRVFQRHFQLYVGNVAAHRQELREVEDKRSLMLAGITVDRRPAELSVFAGGLEKLTPKSVTLSPIAPVKGDEHIYASPLSFLFTAPDLAYVVQMIASLMAILFTFDAISGEKERGTLKLALSYPVPRDRMLVGKWLGAFLSLCLPLLVAALAAIVLFVFSPSVSLNAEGWVRILLMLALSLIYISVFLSLGLLVSARTDRSSVSLLIGLLAWVMLVLGVPSLAPVLARGLSPTLSESQVTSMKLGIERQEKETFAPEFARCKDFMDYDRVWREMKSSVQRRLEQVEEGQRNALRRQIALARNLSRVSPAASYTYAITGLAHTGLEDHGRFTDAFRRYRTQLDSYESLFRSGDFDKPFDPDSVPPFQPTPRPLAVTLGQAGGDLLLLGLLAILLFLASHVSFRRRHLT